MEREADGSLTVRFRAGGVQEMCWHLFTWGTGVSVIAPSSPRDAMAKLGADIATSHKLQSCQFHNHKT